MSLLKDQRIDKEASIPYYYQLKLILQQYLETEHQNPADPIPTEEYLSEIFNISRPTVRQAINELVVEGRLYRVKGKGTFVSEPKIDQTLTMRIESYENEMRQQGITPKTDTLKFQVSPASDKVASRLNIPPGEDVVELWRLRYANNEPVVLSITYLPCSRCPDFNEDTIQNDSLYLTLKAVYGYEVAWISRSMEATLATEYEAEVLKINKGDPIQYFESVAHLENDDPIEFTRAKYRGDRNRFVFRLAR